MPDWKPYLTTNLSDELDPEDPDLDDDEMSRIPRLNAEWTTLSAIREMLGIALKGSIAPSYGQALALGRVLSAELFDSEDSLLAKGQERESVQEYRQRAEAQSHLEGRKIDPVEIIDKEIEYFSQLVEASSRELVQRRLNILRHIRELLLAREYTENQLIIRDLFKAERGIPGPLIEGDKYRDYKLSEDRGLRIRLLHPDPPEHSIGADLVYEHYWDKKKLARIVVVQYKIWNGATLYLSQARNLESQMGRLKATFCDSGLCKSSPHSAGTRRYRLPFCAAFLRPTDKLQSPDARLMSRGLHVPVCKALKACESTGSGGKKIESKRIRSESLSHTVFEEVFNTNMLGSRWLTYGEVEQLYREHKILEPDERIIVHAQEFGIR